MPPGPSTQSLSCLGSNGSTHSYSLSNSQLYKATSHKVPSPPSEGVERFLEAEKSFTCLFFFSSVPNVRLSFSAPPLPKTQLLAQAEILFLLRELLPPNLELESGKAQEISP